MALSLRPANAVKGALVDNSVANDWTYAKMALAVRLLTELFVRAVEQVMRHRGLRWVEFAH